MTVIILTTCPAGLRGFLTRWLLELSPGVFLGAPSAPPHHPQCAGCRSRYPTARLEQGSPTPPLPTHITRPARLGESE
ncbi:type I-E CRISPR-associated endoribonuclease Cas2 [Streptomyces albus]|uniref:type I-E CRISPR-associated endoribonuclease Cas2 n=1 Tax=Streptomyces albus TaxID=1888 RepID=UPI000AF5A909